MRAPNLLSLVIASGCCLLRSVRAQPAPTLSMVDNNSPPSNIRLTPTLVANEVFAVTWDGCSGRSCTVKAFALLQVDLQNTDGIPVQSGTSFTDITALSTISPTSTYEIALSWQTILAGISVSSATTAPQFEPASLTTAPSGSSAENSPPNLSTGTLTPGAASSTTETGTRHTPTTSGFVSGPQTQSPASAPTSTTSGASGAEIPVVSATSSSIASSDSGGLSTGAKVGIAIGAIGIALIVLIGALLIWRRRRQRQLRDLPDGMPYSHDTGSTNRDLTAEKEINVINSPVDTLNNGYSSVPTAAHTQNQPQTGSWGPADEHSAMGGTAAAAAVPYTDTHRRSYGSGYADSSSPGPEMQGATPPTAAASGSSIQRKPVGATSGGTTQHLREPGMSDEEVARLEEEERRLDEAIAEAERKRQVQG